MSIIVNALHDALQLAIKGDATLFKIISVSLGVSGLATLLGAALGLPFGAWVALTSSRLRGPLNIVLNAAMGLPPVVIGLLVYLLLSRSGPLGTLGWLFTPPAMVLAQTILIFPIIAALARQVIDDAHREYRDWFASMGVHGLRRIGALLYESRFMLLTVVLAGFGRAIAEVGAVMIVGGNIDGVTRVMTTAIALETSKGDLGLALALGLILMGIVLGINAIAHGLKSFASTRYG
jgi:tungstate transport system permease protein